MEDLAEHRSAQAHVKITTAGAERQPRRMRREQCLTFTGPETVWSQQTDRGGCIIIRRAE